SEQIATIYDRRNPGIPILGVRYGDMAALQKQIEPDYALAVALWATGVFEARTMALRVLPRGVLTEAQIDAWVLDLNSPPLADEFAQAVYHTPFARAKMEVWIERDEDFVRRAGYSLLYGFAAEPDSPISDAEWEKYLHKVEREIQRSPNWSREMMNFLPVAIGQRSPVLKNQAIATAKAYGKIDVFHGDKTNCKVHDAVGQLNDPRTKVKPY
ncbi:MAG: DNA alkylation repair protein, partial [Thermomicrobiales bacterium]